MKLFKINLYQALILVISLSLCIKSLHAQEKPSLTEGSIENRFNYVIQKSNDYEDYKLVKRWILYRLKSYVLDSLDAMRNELKASYDLSAVKDSGIDSLMNVIQTKNTDIATLAKEKNSMSIAGLNLNKNAYNSIMWSIVFVLTLILIIFFILFKRSNTVTVKTRHALREMKEEYDMYRKRALEREQKVVRELYDEILKYKNKSN